MFIILCYVRPLLITSIVIAVVQMDLLSNAWNCAISLSVTRACAWPPRVQRCARGGIRLRRNKETKGN